MKKLLIINGSPNTEGHTNKIVDAIIKGINANVEIKYINCYDMNIKPCTDCKYCSKVVGACSIKDSMTEIYKLIQDCDIIILASPMYFGMFPSPLKSLIDRCQVIWSKKFIFKQNTKERKQGIFIFNGGSSWNNMFIHMETIGKYFLNTLNCDILFKLYVDNTDVNYNYINEYHDEILKCQNLINKEKILG
ncbi:flavodoxin family protein [Clostridium sp.]|uniref:flavodoxin family protein n=1 Tax=Clostridium sp. TaxID=1506 RepID=UPI0034643EC6